MRKSLWALNISRSLSLTLLVSILFMLQSNLMALSCTVNHEMTPVKNQKRRGTCTVFAINAFLERYTKTTLSEQCFIMVDRRSKEKIHSRKMFRYSFNFLSEHGVVSEKVCPHSYSGFWGRFFDHSLSTKEYEQYADKSSVNVSLIDLDSFSENSGKEAINFIKDKIKRGNPVVAGVLFPDEWNSYTKGIFRLENVNTKKVKDIKNIGFHAIVITAFNDSRQSFTFKNSWGKDWGAKGYGEMSYAYFKWAYNADLGSELFSNRNDWPGAICSNKKDRKDEHNHYKQHYR